MLQYCINTDRRERA